MKNLLTLMFTISLFAFSAKGQESALGVKAEVNYNIMQYDYDNPQQGIAGNAAGIGFSVHGYGVFKFSEMIGLRPELGVSFRPVKQEYSSTTQFFGYTATITSNYSAKPVYVDMPVLFLVEPIENLQFMIGPKLGYAIANTIETESSSNVGFTSTSNEDSQSGKEALENINRMDIALAAGAGYELEMGLNFGLRYTRSFNTFTKNPEGFTDYWNLYSLYVGWTFGQ